VAESSSLTPAEKLGIALELFESGVGIMRETLKREHPTESDAQIEERLRQWRRRRRLRGPEDRPDHEIPVTPLL
jgi:hypothetical protein